MSLRQRWPRPLFLGCLLVAVTFFCQGRTTAQPRPGDPVYEFREALKADRAANKEALEFREKTLKEKAAKVQYLGDIAQVLLFQEWRADDKAANVASVDSGVRAILTDNFEKGIKDIFAAKEPNPILQAGAALLIRETAINARNVTVSAGIYMRNRLRALADDLIVLIKATKDDGVREAAISALGQIEPDPIEPATKSLTEQLATSNNPAVRRTAARALADLIQATIAVDKKGAPDQATAVRSRLIRTAAAVVKAASAGLENSTDVEVRRWCVIACRTVASITAEIIKDPFAADTFPPEGRPWTQTEQKNVEEKREVVDAERKDLAPSLEALQGAVPALAKAASRDPDVGIRIDTRRVLEDIATARHRLALRLGSIPKGSGMNPPEARRNADGPGAEAALAPGVPRPVVPPPAYARDAAMLVSRPVEFEQPQPADDALRESLRKAIDELARSLEPGTPGPKDQVAAVQAKLATIDALEAIGLDAAPALDSLIRALSDQDKFVRWSAARVIGKLSARDPNGTAVPKLAKLTADQHLDVRLAALAALERYGPVAKPAVDPYLRKAAKTGDAEVRVAAMRTLQAIGKDAAPALAAVTKNLSDFYDRAPALANGPEPAHLGGRSLTEANFRVRQTACETLGVLGPLAVKEADPRWQALLDKHVVPVLQKALDDPDDTVRRAASDAILKVLGK